MKAPLFTGACTAIVTPFRDGGVDLDAFSRLLRTQYAGGVTTVLVCGAAGEAPTLTPTEQEALYRRAVQSGGGRMKIIAGIGSNNTKYSAYMARAAADAGADGILMAAPCLSGSAQTGLIEHFTYVADRSPLPVIVCSDPARNGAGVAPETYALLAGHPNICGAAEASGDTGALSRAMYLCGDGLNFWSGRDSDAVAKMSLGAKGVISTASNIVPEAVSRLCQLCRRGDFEAASALNRQYAELFHILGREVGPVPVKTALGLMGRCAPDMRLPLVPMGVRNRADLAECLVRYGLMQ